MPTLARRRLNGHGLTEAAEFFAEWIGLPSSRRHSEFGKSARILLFHPDPI
jgi:hypothetical protein